MGECYERGEEGDGEGGRREGEGRGGEEGRQGGDAGRAVEIAYAAPWVSWFELELG